MNETIKAAAHDMQTDKQAVSAVTSCRPVSRNDDDKHSCLPGSSLQSA